MKELDNQSTTEKDISPEKQEELGIMKDRIISALHDQEVRESTANDFIYTFGQLGLDKERSKALTAQIFEELQSSSRLDISEGKILKDFQDIKVGDKNLVQILEESLKERAKKIFGQLKEHLKDVKGEGVDYGAGDGQVTQLIQDELGFKMVGYDPREYKRPGIKVTIKKFDGGNTGEENGHFGFAVMTNVAHHEKDNKKILDELTRIIKPGGRLVVIETVPVGATPGEIKKDHERTFMNDYLYNRLFHNADVPVPGTFEIPEDWIKRFEAKGWRLVNSENLGVDQPTINDTHHLLVFEKM
ncbi:MAG: class I SAM-dependent methyltransferase [Candidatus Pacebacteria bacterium]|nr:class I SAM-dependent methyltransferase [Candidatus Paceibacterota bacterium]MDD5357463.1 class I SAM-dependent methyltransferase [Candidatus Paceibacterota bacterium]